MLEYSIALSYLRADLIKEGVDIITRLADESNNNKIDKFVKYLRKYWLPIANIISVWNVPIRTNNLCENFHMLVNKRYGRHPRLWNMLRTYNNESSLNFSLTSTQN